MSIQMTSKNLPSATSSLELQDGLSPSEWLDGLIADLYGQEALPASPSATPARGSGQTTPDISLPPLPASSESVALQGFLANRLAQRLRKTGGSMIYGLDWRQKATPLDFPYCQLLASVPRIKESESTSEPGFWYTPTTNVNPQPATARGLQTLFGQARHLAAWPTAAASDPSGGGSASIALRKLSGDKRPSGASLHSGLRDFVQLAAWPTVTTIDNNQVRGVGAAANAPDRGTTLGGAVRLASWPTPTTRDWKDGSECLNVPTNSLLGRVVWLADQPIRITASGMVLTGSDAGMESSGQLDPAHSRWLMGFPDVWCDCAPTETRSSRRSPRSSSSRSKKPSKTSSDLDELI